MGTRLRTARLVHRELEMGALTEAMAAVGDSEGALLLLSGEAGVGKTRLLDEFAQRGGARVVRGGCVHDIAYAPWTDALWWMLGPGELDTAELPATMRAQLGRLMPQLLLDDTAPGDGQHLLFEAIVELLTRAAARGPLALVIDDVHWIDPASIDVLRYVVQNLRRLPILLVVAYRPEHSGQLRDLFALLGRLANARIALQPLDDEGVAEMASQLLDRDVDTPQVQRIVQAAEGNPFFVEELALATGHDSVPDSLRELLLGNVHRLPPDSRALVRAAAVIGLRAPRALLGASNGFDETQAQSAARAAVDGGVLVADDDGRGYDFRHALLRQAVLDELLPDERVAQHRAIADTLTRSPEVAAGIDRVAELARHWDLAEQPREALRWLSLAGDQAVLRYAFEAATSDYERALSWWDIVDDASEITGRDHVEVLLAAADAAGLAGHIRRAADLARRALDEAAPDAARCVEAVGRAYPLLWSADRAEELRPFAASALPVLEQAPPAAQAHFLEQWVDEHLREFLPAEALEYAPRMVAAATAAGDTELEIRSHWLHAHCYELLGETERADSEYERAVEIGRRESAYPALVLALYNKACLYTTVPDWTRAASILDEVDELIDRYGVERYRVPSLCQRTYLEVLRGDLATARMLVAAASEPAPEGLAGWFVAMTSALGHLLAGEPADAIATIDPAHVGIEEVHDIERTLQVSVVRSESHAWLGDIEAARAATDRGIEVIGDSPETYWHAWLHMIALRVEADAATAATARRIVSDVERAHARADAMRETFAHSCAVLHREYPWVQAFATGAAAEYARLAGEERCEASAAAAAAFESIDIPYYAAYFRFREAEAAFTTGDSWHATQLLSSARASAQQHGFSELEQTINSLARREQVRLGPGRTTVDGDEPLSDREQEVLRLLVDGLSNAEIGGKLYISTRTARSHVSNILRKLGVTTRVEAVADAHRRGLV